MVEADTVNTFKYRLDKHWSNQHVLCDFNADLTGTEVYQSACDRNTCTVAWLEFNVPFQHKYGYIRDDIIYVRCGQRGLPAPVRTHWIGYTVSACR